MTLGVRVGWSGAIAVVVTALATAVAADRWSAARAEDALVRELERDARLVAAALSSRPAGVGLAANRFGLIIGRRVTIVDEAGVVVGDSDFDAAAIRLLENHADRPEIRSAFESGIGVARRVSASTARDEIKVAVAAWPGVVRVSAPAAELAALTPPAGLAALIGLWLGGMVAGLLLWASTRGVSRPLRGLTEAMAEAGAGHVPRLAGSGVPEVQQSLLAFRVMAERLRSRIESLTAEREQTRAIIDGTVEGIVAANARGRIVHLNPAAREFLGLETGQDAPGLTELFHEKGARAVVDRVRKGEIETGREVDLRGRAILMTARPLRDGGAVLGLLDVTESRKVHAVRRDFVANVSHELKTPLTSILGYTETLLAGDVDTDLAEQFLETVRQNAQRMQRLVEDLLDLARVESGAWAPRLEPQDLGTLAREAWGALGDRVAEAEVELALDLGEDFRLTADREAVQHILANLFDNAIRYTPAGGTVTVEGRQAGDHSVVTVSDTGSGIPAEHQSRIFERFYRVDPGRSRDEGGTGLGLSIVKHLVEVHGGQVSLESAVGRGTAVRLRFPRQEPAAAA